jgi:hypothetical protein
MWNIAGKACLMIRWLLCILTIIALGFTIANAQAVLSVGPALGMNYNDHSGSDIPSKTTGFGLVLGGQADLAFSKSIGLLATIAFDNRIGKYSETGMSGGIEYSTDASVTIAYLSIEPLFKYTLPNRPFYLVTGPVLSFPVQGKAETSTQILTSGYSFPNGYSFQTLNTKVENMKTRFEWKIGGGYTMRIDKKTALLMHLVYARGFSDVVDGMDWKVNSISFLASFEFALGQ